MAKTERLQLRVSAEMKEQLEKIAAADGRSVTNYIERLVQREIELHALKQEQPRSCRNCKRVCIGEDGTYKDIEGGCDRWERARGK